MAYQNREYEKAFKEFTELANSGNKKAQNYLGVMYENGYGVSRDFDVAISWYQKAINQGFTGAKYNLKTLEYKINEEKLAIKLALLEAELQKELKKQAALEAEAKKKAEAEAKNKIEQDFKNAQEAYLAKDYKLAIFFYKKATLFKYIKFTTTC